MFHVERVRLRTRLVLCLQDHAQVGHGRRIFGPLFDSTTEHRLRLVQAPQLQLISKISIAGVTANEVLAFCLNRVETTPCDRLEGHAQFRPT